MRSFYWEDVLSDHDVTLITSRFMNRSRKSGDLGEFTYKQTVWVRKLRQTRWYVKLSILKCNLTCFPVATLFWMSGNCMNFVAITAFFSNRFSALQRGSSVQSHRHLKIDIWNTFSEKLLDFDSGINWPTFRSRFQCNCWKPHWMWLLVANLSPML